MRNRTRVLGIAMIVIGVIALFGQLGSNRWERSERRAMPEMPAMPAMPAMPEMPEMPAMPDIDHEFSRFERGEFNGFEHGKFGRFEHAGPWIGGQIFKLLAVLLLVGLFIKARRRRNGYANDHSHATIHRF